MREYIRYARTSQRQQPHIAIDISNQLKEITTYARQHGLKILRTETDSGSAKEIQSSGFKNMIEIIRDDIAIGILCTNLDRLTRDFRTSFLLYQLIQEGLEIVTPRQIYNKNTDETVLTLDLLISQIYNRTHSEYMNKSIKRGIQAKQGKTIKKGVKK